MPRDLIARLDLAIGDGELGRAEFDATECRTLRALLGAAPHVRVGLVGCGKVKLDRPAPARDLYTGSLFAMARRYAEARCDRWWILSAAHGLVTPDTILDPYEATLGADNRKAWAVRVAAQLRDLVPSSVSLVLLAGDPYGDWRRDVPHVVEEPLRGLGIGERRAWLAREISGCTPLSKTGT